MDLQLLDRLHCRNQIWLTSRPEFLDAHFPVDQNKPGGGWIEVLKVEGVATNRELLVARIFARYTSRDALNPTRFLELVDSIKDGETRDLSHNPLFLTVMCYVYAKERLEPNSGRLDAFRTFDEIIERCIRLLVRDRDSERVRELPPSRRALLKARGEHGDEKDEFLRSFAGRLYADERNLFDAQYLRGAALDFFAARGTPQAAEIVEELKGATIGVGEDIVTQLIYCGLFVRQAQGGLYDFPHRRFREVLAWRHYEQNPDVLLDSVGKVFWHELVLFVFARYSQAETIFGRLLELAVREPDQPTHGGLAARCYANVSERNLALASSLRGALDGFFEERLADGLPFRLPASLPQALTANAGWVEHMTGRLHDRLRKRKPGLKFLCEVVSVVDRSALPARAGGVLGRRRHDAG